MLNHLIVILLVVVLVFVVIGALLALAEWALPRTAPAAARHAMRSFFVAAVLLCLIAFFSGGEAGLNRLLH